MSKGVTKHTLVMATLALAGAITYGMDTAHAQASPLSEGGVEGAFAVDAGIALHALMSLGDAHMQRVADDLAIFAGSEAARSADWMRIRDPLAVISRMTVPAAHWFALPDGTYWTEEAGRIHANLSDRAYFPNVLRGEAVIGDLVVSHSTNRNTAIVAVPVRGDDGAIVGVLGSSIRLDSLSAIIRSELGGLTDDLFFFAIDAEPLGALHSDPAMIFTDPMRLGDDGMRSAFAEILATPEGVVTYTFEGRLRTVVYRKSPVTGWWYGLGRYHAER